jgi:hypothetical protein
MGTQTHEINEAMVLEILRHEPSMKLEAVIPLFPQLSWNQIFQCVDSLSRRGEIILLRKGFEYELVCNSTRRQDTTCLA